MQQWKSGRTEGDQGRVCGVAVLVAVVLVDWEAPLLPPSSCDVHPPMDRLSVDGIGNRCEGEEEEEDVAWTVGAMERRTSRFTKAQCCRFRRFVL